MHTTELIMYGCFKLQFTITIESFPKKILYMPLRTLFPTIPTQHHFYI